MPRKTRKTSAPRRRRQPSQAAPNPNPLSARAVRTFTSLDPCRQTIVLNVMASLARVPQSRLYATNEQRQEARAFKAECKAENAHWKAIERERMEIWRKLNALHNRAQERRTHGFTPTEERRRNALYTRLNEIDRIGGVK